MKKTILLSIAATLALAACAPGPNAVAPASYPAGAFDKMSCSRAQEEYKAATAEVQALSQKQRSAATGDAIGVFLIGVPASSVFGGDVQGELSVAKGKKLALEARLANC